MSIMARVREMMFGRSSQKPDPVQAQVAIAVQRNEEAGEKARRALEQYQMTKTLLEIAERM